MPLTTLRSPATLMEHQPYEKFAFCRRSGFVQDLSTLRWMLAYEESTVSRRSGELPVRSPFPANAVTLVGIQVDITREIPYVEVVEDDLHSKGASDVPRPAVAVQS